MRQFTVYDDMPITDPDNDLLSMKARARGLAHYLHNVEPPFTIAVYGKWGEGKTTFVNLTRHFLEQKAPPEEVKFIEFTALPYATSDELWRALIIRIAKKLYDVEDDQEDEETSQGQGQESGLLPAIASFLKADAIPLRMAPEPQDPLADYKELLARLARTPHGSVSKNAQQRLQIDHEQALLAIANAAARSLSSMSPLVVGIRELLGLQKEIDLSELFQTRRNESTQKSIESLNEFIDIFKERFNEKASGKKVFVFVDDLDRCFPDVALDILEAIKVLLREVKAVFVVAADEALIGKGLRLRFKDLPEESIDFAQRGKEYFEKIIQFSVRVPVRSRQMTHAYVAAQFPHWMPVTDILQTVIGNNPRRLKQYSNSLSYQYVVYHDQQLLGETEEGEP